MNTVDAMNRPGFKSCIEELKHSKCGEWRLFHTLDRTYVNGNPTEDITFVRCFGYIFFKYMMFFEEDTHIYYKTNLISCWNQVYFI